MRRRFVPAVLVAAFGATVGVAAEPTSDKSRYTLTNRIDFQLILETYNWVRTEDMRSGGSRRPRTSG